MCQDHHHTLRSRPPGLDKSPHSPDPGPGPKLSAGRPRSRRPRTVLTWTQLPVRSCSRPGQDGCWGEVDSTLGKGGVRGGTRGPPGSGGTYHGGERLGSQSSSLHACGDRRGAQHSHAAPALHKGVPPGWRWSCRGCLPRPVPSTQPSAGPTRKIGARSYSHKDAANTDGSPGLLTKRTLGTCRRSD